MRYNVWGKTIISKIKEVWQKKWNDKNRKKYIKIKNWNSAAESK